MRENIENNALYGDYDETSEYENNDIAISRYAYDRMKTRIESELDGRPAAVMMNEPNVNFGVHSGDLISFEWIKQDNKMIEVARLPWMIDQ